MKSINNSKPDNTLTLFQFLLTFSCLIILSPEIQAQGIDTLSRLNVPDRYDTTVAQKQDLLLFGFGELLVHSWDIKGDIRAFELNNSSFQDKFSTNYRTSIFANGNLNRKFFVNGVTVLDSRLDDEYRHADPSVFRLKMSMTSTEPLWDNWRFTGETVYDPNRQWEYGNLDTRLFYQPQRPARLEMLAQLESEKNGYIEGGSLRSSFKEARFSLYNRSLFGAYADLHSGPIGVEAVGGKLEGKTFREGAVVGIRADGTTGPYDLKYAPVTRGSEEVKIEVRDRFNESTVLSSRTMLRDVDYTVDYERGRIILYQPVASETIASDPVFIVITYDYQRSENDEILGSRLKVSPIEGTQMSATYLHRFIDDEAEGAGAEEPEDLVTGDINLDMKKYGQAYIEIGGAENPDVDETSTALRTGWEGKITSQLGFKAAYQRVEDQYRTFGNTDLIPTLNQQRWHLEGNFELSEKHKITGSFNRIRGLEANGQYNTYPGHRDEKIYAMGFQNRLSDDFRFGLNLERRDIENADDPATEDNRQHRIILDLDGRKDSVPVLRLFTYGLHYEFITRQNFIASTGNTNTNQAALTVGSEPSRGTRLDLTQKIQLTKDRDLDTWSAREDATFASARVQPFANLSSRATLEYKRFTVPGDDLKLWQDYPTKIERSGTFAVEYLPLASVKSFGKFGRYEIEQWWHDSTSRNTNDFIMGQVTYFYSHHLSFNAESEYTRKVYLSRQETLNKVWDLGFRVNWNKNRLNDFTIGLIRRWQLNDYPQVKELTTTSYIFLVNGSVGLGRGFFARASIKDIFLQEILDDEKTHLSVEVGYENVKWYRVSLGFERIENQPDELYADEYYRGQGLFFRLVGKF